MEESKYYVSGIDNVGSVYYGDDPVKAIHAWFANEPRDRMSVSIQARDNECAYELLVTAQSYSAVIRQWAKVYHISYDIDWLLKEVERKVTSDNRSIVSWTYDQVYPFCINRLDYI